MKEIFIGEVIHQQRLALGLTQEELCQGICEPITISRLENGKQTPSRNRIRALLQRLGLPDDRFFGLLSEKELQISALEKELVSCHMRFTKSAPAQRPAIREEALAKHRELEALMDRDDTLLRQRILRSRYLLGTESGPYSLEEGIELLLQAMRMTSPNFSLDEIGRGLYTEEEIKLINNMAGAYANAGRHYDAIDIWKPLLRYLQHKTGKLPPDRVHIPLVGFNYALQLEIVKRYDESLEIAEYTRRICIDYGAYTTLPELLMVMAECHYHLGHREESAELYKQAYYLFKVLEDERNLPIIRVEAKEFLGLELM